MILRTIQLCFLSLVLLCQGISAHAQGIAVLELFTTQGCSNCPPADALFKDMVSEKDENLITLSCHVTYFDRDGFRDVLSKNFCDARHGGYLNSLSLNSIYTPQMIINGQFDTIGNRERTVRAGVKMAQGINTVTKIPLSIRDGYLDISLPKMRFGKPVELWLFAYDDLHKIDVGSGQNFGRSIDYVNAVRHLTKLMDWNGQYMNMAYPLSEIPADGYAIIAQYADHTNIVAAGKVGK